METWRIFGANHIYVSKSGSDATGTTGSTTDPFLTVGAAMDYAESIPGITVYTFVVGAGYYNERININTNSSRYIIVADGNVVMTGLTTGGQIFTGAPANSQVAINNIQFESIGTFSSGSHIFEFSDCIFRDVNSSTNSTSYTRCILINSALTGSGLVINKCSFIGSSLGEGTYDSNCLLLSDSYFDGTSVIRVLNIAATVLVDHNNYNFPAGFTVELNDIGTFTTYNSLATFRIAVPAWNQNSLEGAPGFNGFSPEDFTLDPNSPMAYAASDGKHIGAYDIAVSHGLGQAFAPATATLTNVVSGATGYVLATGQSVGTILSGAIDLGSRQTVSRIRLFATQFHPGDVVDHSNNTTDTPNHQTYELWWGDTPASLVGPHIMEWNTIPMVNDNAGVLIGNGEPAFDVNAAQHIQAQYLQVRVTIRNNGLPA